MHAYNPSTGETETGGSQVQDQPGIHRSVSKGEKKKENKREKVYKYPTNHRKG
jgi:hypothetical protein